MHKILVCFVNFLMKTIIKRRKVGGRKTVPKNITCLAKRKAKFLDGAIYIRKYPKFQTITVKLKMKKD